MKSPLIPILYILAGIAIIILTLTLPGPKYASLRFWMSVSAIILLIMAFLRRSS